MILGTPKTPKSLDELQTFSEPELKELFRGMEKLVTGGTPLEIPAAIPIGQLGRIVATLQRYHTLMERVAYAEAGMEVPGMDQIIEKWDKLQEEAQALIHAKAPPEKSRLILPK